MTSEKKDLIKEILSFEIVRQCKEHEYKKGYAYHYEVDYTEAKGDYVGDYNTKANFQDLIDLPFVYGLDKINFRIRDIFEAELKDLQSFIDGLSAITNYGVICDTAAYEILEENKGEALKGLSSTDLKDIFVKAFEGYGKDFTEILCLEFLSTQKEIYFDKGEEYRLAELVEIILDNEERFASIWPDVIQPFEQAILENSEMEYSGVDNFFLVNTNVLLCDTFPYLMPDNLGFHKVEGVNGKGKKLKGWIK